MNEQKQGKKMKVMWDLFSGLGGASQYFECHPDWEVYRIENNHELRHHVNYETIWEDVKNWKEWSLRLPDPDFIWASPPCYEFSNAFHSPRSKAQREGNQFEPNMDLVQVTKEIIDRWKPKHWAVENVVGASNYLSPLFGRYQKVGPFMIWGNLPVIDEDIPDEHKSQVDQRHSVIRANIRARIPMQLSRGIYNAINQPRLEDFV